MMEICTYAVEVGFDGSNPVRMCDTLFVSSRVAACRLTSLAFVLTVDTPKSVISKD